MIYLIHTFGFSNIDGITPCWLVGNAIGKYITMGRGGGGYISNKFIENWHVSPQIYSIPASKFLKIVIKHTVDLIAFGNGLIFPFLCAAYSILPGFKPTSNIKEEEEADSNYVDLHRCHAFVVWTTGWILSSILFPDITLFCLAFIAQSSDVQNVYHGQLDTIRYILANKVSFVYMFIQKRSALPMLN